MEGGGEERYTQKRGRDKTQQGETEGKQYE